MAGTPTTPARWSTGPLTLTVIGAGVMGRGIAQVAAAAGCDVRLTDTDPRALRDAVGFIGGMLDRAAAKGRISTTTARRAQERIHPASTMDGALAGADAVIEAVAEDLAVKRDLLREVERRVGPGVVLASNTSALSVSAIGAALRRPDRLCGMHFFNPVPLMRLVEVVPGERTGEDVVDALVAVAKRFGHTAVRVADSPGFLVNHAGRAYSTEALCVVDEGVATPEQVDRLCREVAGFPMGPFELFDLTGLDVSVPVTETVFHDFYGDPRLRPSPTARRRRDAGLLGRKTTEGFYRYADGVRVEPPHDADASPYEGEPVWIGGVAPDLQRLRELLKAAGVAVEDAERPSRDAVLLVAPWGADVTSQLVDHQLPADRSLGVDPFGGYAGHLTLAATPATSPRAAATAYAALAATGRPVTPIADSPGFVVQRIVAAVVNTAAEIAQRRIATPGDIDTAVALGLGYPMGPLSWGDAIGPATVLAALTGIHQVTGDPRYRPSQWLSRRARLGLSLLAEDRTPATRPEPTTRRELTREGAA